MKKTTTAVFLSLFVFVIVFGQPPKKLMINDESENVKTRLNQLFSFAQKEEFKKASAFIAYKGTDTVRRLKSGLNTDIPDELDQVKAVCTNIKTINENAKQVEFHQFYMEREKDQTWYFWKLLYHEKTDQTDTANYGFLKVGDKFILGNVR